MTEQTLFDDVFEKTGFSYLSDLRLSGRNLIVLSAVNAVDAQAYSADEWRQFASYLTGQSLPLDSVDDVRQYLREYLKAAGA